MIEDEIGQYVELVGIVDEIVEGGEDIDIYWENSIEIEINKIVNISNIIKLCSDNLVIIKDWLRSSWSW